MLEFVPPQIRNALNYSVDCRIHLTRQKSTFFNMVVTESGLDLNVWKMNITF